MKQITAHNLAKAKAWRASGIVDSVIAREIGVSRQRVHQLLGPRPPRQARLPLEPSGQSRVDFATAVRGWRSARGLSQSQAAKLLCVSTHTFACWEQGYSGCSIPGAILKLMDLLPA